MLSWMCGLPLELVNLLWGTCSKKTDHPYQLPIANSFSAGVGLPTSLCSPHWALGWLELACGLCVVTAVCAHMCSCPVVFLLGLLKNQNWTWEDGSEVKVLAEEVKEPKFEDLEPT